MSVLATMIQEGEHPKVLDVDGLRDPKHPDLMYWGKATQREDGTWWCLAQLGPCLMVVELNVTFPETPYTPTPWERRWCAPWANRAAPGAANEVPTCAPSEPSLSGPL